MVNKVLIWVLILVSAALSIVGCSRRGSTGSEESSSDVWGLQITSIESSTGLPYIESNVNSDGLSQDDSAVLSVVNRYPDYFLDSEGKIDPSYNVTITKYIIELTIPNYPLFRFDRKINVQIPASTTDTATTVEVIVVPSSIKPQLATIVDAEGGRIDGTARIRLEGEYGNNEEAWTTGDVSVRFTSQP